MNEKNLSSKNKSLKKPSYLWIVVLLIVLISVAGIYLWQLSSNKQSSSLPTITTSTSSNQEDDQVYEDQYFSYSCPAGWYMGESMSYNGEVYLSECSKIYSGNFAFDDGVMVTIGYVSQEIADKIDKVTEKKYSDMILDQVKDEDNLEVYMNNNFSGWISPKNQKHTLSLIARQSVDGGYYEFFSTAMGDTKTYEQYREIIDQIIQSFKLK
jgi:hypothetical protein